MKVEKITDNIIHIILPTQKILAETFMRVQEHYESPNENFKDKVFTTGQFREWYSKENGGFTYNEDWRGFNVPAYAFKPFISGLFDPLTEQESRLVDLFRSRTDDFYVIGTYEDDPINTLEHEVIHGMFYILPEYRKAVLKELAKWDKELVELKAQILNYGYHKDVLYDECNAYIVADREYLKKTVGLELPDGVCNSLTVLHKKFKAVLK